MRWLLVVVAVGLVAGVGWLLFGEPSGRTRVALSDPRDNDPTLKPWMALKSGTLTVRVKGPDGTGFVGAQVGYDTPRDPRLYYTDDDGVRTLAGVPLGDLTVVVQAPGYETVRRRTRVEPGVTEEITVILSPAREGPPR